MEKLDAIKAFIEKSAAVRAELLYSATKSSCHYSSHGADCLIEQQQELKRLARRLHIISVKLPLFDEADYRVHISFDEFIKLVDLDECEEKVWQKEEATYHKYSIVIDNLVLFAMKEASNEEHKNAQAI